MTNKNSSSKKRSYRKQPPGVAYSITLPSGHTLKIKKSANAWWMNEQLVREMVSAFRFDSTVEEACAYAGITERQYKYFIEIHPKFPEIREGFKHLLTLKARQTIVKGLDDFDRATWYLAKKKPEEFGRQSGKKRFVADPNFKPKVVLYEKLVEEQAVRKRAEGAFQKQQNEIEKKYKTRDESGGPDPYPIKHLKPL